MMKRDCPHCFISLEKSNFNRGIWSVETDICPSCKGLYLDKGELLKLTSNRPLHNITTKYLGVDSDSKLLCPGCGSIMDMESVGGVVAEAFVIALGKTNLGRQEAHELIRSITMEASLKHIQHMLTKKMLQGR